MFDKPITELSVDLPQGQLTNVGMQNPGEFDKLILARGYDVLYDKAMRCPCMVRESGNGSPSCVNCKGLGWFFIDRQKTRMFVTNKGQSKRQENWQETDLGTASITSRATDRLTFMDRVIMTEMEAVHTEVLFMERRENGQLFSYTIYNPIEIELAYLFDGNESKLIKEIPNEVFDLSYFEKGVIAFNENNKYVQTFFKNNDTLKLSIRYLHNPVYHIVDVNRDLIKTRGINCQNTEFKTSLPIKYMAKKAQYIFDNHNLSGSQIENN